VVAGTRIALGRDDWTAVAADTAYARFVRPVGGGSDRRLRPAPLNEMVSAQMSRMPRRDSGPEISLRRYLHRCGLRYRLQVRALPGTPDIVMPRARVAVFVDGCFWHGCPEHGGIPKNNAEWWSEKILATQARDRTKDLQLVALGWLPVHVWEHDCPERAGDLIAALWRKRTG
jgi:DNA mismatch endonuclease (patch repair protein)